MNLQKSILDAIEIVKLNKKTIKKIATSETFLEGLLIIIIGGILSAVATSGSAIFVSALSFPVNAIIGTFIWTGVLWLFAK